MNHEFKKSDRVAASIQRKLSVLIAQEIRDPRMPAFVTISALDMHSDLSHAKVYFTVLDEKTAKDTENVLNHAASHLRSLLAKTMKQRTVPQLHFVYDSSIDYGRRLSQLIDKANAVNRDDGTD